MVRGIPGQKRSHCVSVRVTPEELETWRAAQAATGRRELGAWVRAVVTESLTGRPGVPGDVPTVPLVNAASYGQLVQAANNLNQLTRYAHQTGELHADIQAAIAEVGRAALAVRGLGPDRATPEDDEHQAVTDVR
ncbi:plasmid mobilization relaxosome protein MobC [Streptomyces sp. NPDC001668]|uniref:plasmid mobilization relaxosome protein MobC n=1 Tax=unclassified Streptomyces TaxID=2593676 RepID=UPI0033BDF81D